MPSIASNKSDDSKRVIVLVSVLIVVMVGGFTFSQSGAKLMTSKEKYPARAFVARRKGPAVVGKQGAEKTKTRYLGVGSASGLKVDVDFDKSEQTLKLKIKGRNGETLRHVSLDVRVSRVGQTKKQTRFNMKITKKGEYRSGPMRLAKGGWVLMVTAYDRAKYGGEKLLFHTEKPIFVK